MRITIDSELKDLVMPDCRVKDIAPHQLIKQIILQHYQKPSSPDEEEKHVKIKENRR